MTVIFLFPAFAACNTTGIAENKINGANSSVESLQISIPSAERIVSEEKINLGNDYITTFVKVVEERELLQMDTYTSYPSGSVDVTLKYATGYRDQAQAIKDAEKYITFLTETEGFVCSNPQGQTIPGGYIMYELGKDSVDQGMKISLSIYIDPESHLISIGKAPAQSLELSI
ncbi:MAG: hypothetical protein FWF88_10095 [Peptococcaceae bacterium]|nr:hypothetical protein [Peptococcaceae bacterium]